MSIRTFLIVVVATILFIFDTEGGTISGRIGARVFSGRSTSWQTGSSSHKIGWNLPLSGYYKELVSRTSNGNPTSLSEFAFGTSRMNTQSRYPSTNISPYSSSGGYPGQSVRDPYHGTGNLRYLPPNGPNINPSYPNYDDYDDSHPVPA